MVTPRSVVSLSEKTIAYNTYMECSILLTSCLIQGCGNLEGCKHLVPVLIVTVGNWAKIDAHLRKNRLNRPKIKQGTTSKVNCILFNRLLSPVLLNKSDLVFKQVFL